MKTRECVVRESRWGGGGGEELREVEREGRTV